MLVVGMKVVTNRKDQEHEKSSHNIHYCNQCSIPGNKR